MDQIRKRAVNEATDAFVASIGHSKICKIASDYHPEHKPCRVFGDARGDFNICYFVVFTSREVNTDEADADQADTDERWVMRIPLAPRLAFPEEKTRSEIATMKYVASNTSIPVPHVYGYGFSQTHPSGLTFMLISYVPGKRLAEFIFGKLEEPQRAHLYAQLATIYIQLRHCEFPHIGALTLDPTDNETPVFARNRPLDIIMNEHEMGGLEVSSIVGPSKVYTTAIDYIYMLTRLLFNQFDKQKNGVFDKEDAELNLYGLHQFRSVLMDWLRSETNPGPFVLIHGDFHVANIIVDDNLNITGVLDWEWSRTVPVQMIVPPPWLKGCGVRGLLDYQGREYMKELEHLRNVVKTKEAEMGDKYSGDEKIPLSEYWAQISKGHSYFIAHALLRLDVAGDVYWDLIDKRLHDGQVSARVESFYKARPSEKESVTKKLEKFETYRTRLRELGLEDDKPAGTLSPSQIEKRDAYVKKCAEYDEARLKMRAEYEELLFKMCAENEEAKVKRERSLHVFGWAAVGIAVVVTLSRKHS